MKRFAYILAAVFVISQSFAPAYPEDIHDKASAELLIEEDRLDEAVKLLDSRLAADDKDVYTMSLRADVYRRKGDHKKAAKLLDRAGKTDPTDPMPNFYRGKLFFAMQNFDGAVTEFDLYINKTKPLLTTEDARLYFVDDLHDIVQIYFGIKKYEDLYKTLEEILKIYPDDPTALYNLGLYYYYSQRNRSKAYACLKSVMENNPKSPEAAKAEYAMEFIRANPDPRFVPDDSFLEQEFRE